MSGNAPLNIKMVPDTQALDEVVVIGYGTVKKRDLTGAVASVKSEDITMNPGVNPMDALQGKIAGLDITNSSGQAGSSPTVQLRGTRSLQLDEDGNISSDAFKPTYIIDGMPGDIATLNPNDIESIEVLKDVSAPVEQPAQPEAPAVEQPAQAARVSAAPVEAQPVETDDTAADSAADDATQLYHFLHNS